MLPLNLFTDGAFKLIALHETHAFILQASDLQHTGKHRVCDTPATTAGDSCNLFRAWAFPNLLPIVPNRRCLRASITSLFACQVYICKVSGRCSRSTAPARLATNALLRPVTNCNIFGIGNKRSRECGCPIGSFPLHARKEGGFPCSTKNRSIAP